MALTILVASKEINGLVTDTVIAAWIATLTVAHVYGWTAIPISSEDTRLVLLYD